MPIYDFRCKTCNTVHESLVRMGTETHTCPSCGNVAKQVILKAPALDNYGIAMNGGGPEFKKRVNRMMNDRRDKEEKSLREHGDYGASTGYKTPPSN